jgi:hypothetical protein
VPLFDYHLIETRSRASLPIHHTVRMAAESVVSEPSAQPGDAFDPVLVEISVELPDSQTAVLSIKSGDDPAAKVDEFLQLHGLDPGSAREPLLVVALEKHAAKKAQLERYLTTGEAPLGETPLATPAESPQHGFEDDEPSDSVSLSLEVGGGDPWGGRPLPVDALSRPFLPQDIDSTNPFDYEPLLASEADDAVLLPADEEDEDDDPSQSDRRAMFEAVRDSHSVASSAAARRMSVQREQPQQPRRRGLEASRPAKKPPLKVSKQRAAATSERLFREAQRRRETQQAEAAAALEKEQKLARAASEQRIQHAERVLEQIKEGGLSRSREVREAVPYDEKACSVKYGGGNTTVGRAVEHAKRLMEREQRRQAALEEERRRLAEARERDELKEMRAVPQLSRNTLAMIEEAEKKGSELARRDVAATAASLERERKERQELEACTFRPAINPRSEKMASRRAGPVVDRLAADARRRQEELSRVDAAPPEGCTFKPEVNGTPVERGGAVVFDRLYQQAQDLASKMEELRIRRSAIDEDGTPLFVPNARHVESTSPSVVTERLVHAADERERRRQEAERCAQMERKLLAATPFTNEVSERILQQARRRALAPVFALLQRSCVMSAEDRSRRLEVLADPGLDTDGMGGLDRTLLRGIHPLVPLSEEDLATDDSRVVHPRLKRERAAEDARAVSAWEGVGGLDVDTCWPPVLPPALSGVVSAALEGWSPPPGGEDPSSSGMSFGEFCERVGSRLEHSRVGADGTGGAWLYGQARRHRREHERLEEVASLRAVSHAPSINPHSRALASRTDSRHEKVGSRLHRLAEEQDAARRRATAAAEERRKKDEDKEAEAVRTFRFRARPLPDSHVVERHRRRPKSVSPPSTATVATKTTFSAVATPAVVASSASTAPTMKAEGGLSEAPSVEPVPVVDSSGFSAIETRLRMLRNV